MDRAVFHIGTIKTGSTAAQQSFHAARPALAARGLHYAKGQTHGFWTRAIRNRDRAEPLPPPVAKARARMAKLPAEARAVGPGTWFVSTETFSELDDEGVALFRHSVAEVIPGVPLRILLYVRHPVAYVVSAAQQQIKARLDTIEKHEAAGYDGALSAMVERWRREFGADALLVRPFEAGQLQGGAIQTDILHAIGHADCAPLVGTARANPSLSMNAALVADRVNRLMRERSIARTPERKAIKVRRIQAIGGPRFSFSAPALARLARQAAADVEWLRTAAGVEFREPPPAPVPQADLLPDREIARLADEILAELTAA